MKPDHLPNGLAWLVHSLSLPSPGVSAVGVSDSFLPPNLDWPAYACFPGLIISGIPFPFHKCFGLNDMITLLSSPFNFHLSKSHSNIFSDRLDCCDLALSKTTLSFLFPLLISCLLLFRLFFFFIEFLNSKTILYQRPPKCLGQCLAQK